MNIKNRTSLPWNAGSRCGNNRKRKKEDEQFFDLDQKYNKIDNAATERKKQDYFIDLFDDVLDEDNPFNDTMKTEDIFIDDSLFDNTDQTEIKKVSEDVLQDTNIDQNKALFVDLPEEWPEKVKTTPRKITPNAHLEVAANRIFKKISKTKTNKRTLNKIK